MPKAIAEPVCGQRRMYQLGCRCEACMEANRSYQAMYRQWRIERGSPLVRHRPAQESTPVLT